VFAKKKKKKKNQKKNPPSLSSGILCSVFQYSASGPFSLFSYLPSSSFFSIPIDVYAIILAAGPFVYTSKPIVDACIRTRTHYLDITGEYEVFESILSRHQEAVDVGIVLLPGIGMDVVPTDCLASKLKASLANATHLQMALLPMNGGISPGTMKTVIMSMSKPTKVRKDGEIKDSTNPPGKLLEWHNPDLGTVQTQPLSWGDISTAYRSTKIPNIAIYLLTSIDTAGKMSGWVANSLRWVAGWQAGRWMLNKMVDRFVTGPTEEQNANSRVHFSGMAWDERTKEVVECSLTTAEGYQLTALSMIHATHKLATTHKALSGALTPSQAFGTDYVLEFEHSAWGELIQKSVQEDFLTTREF
jgi:short subunit dehydrogenase-like uncharacterized protein